MRRQDSVRQATARAPAAHPVEVLQGMQGSREAGTTPPTQQLLGTLQSWSEGPVSSRESPFATTVQRSTYAPKGSKGCSGSIIPDQRGLALHIRGEKASTAEPRAVTASGPSVAQPFPLAGRTT